MKNNYSQLSSDLLYLYSKTKHKGIEDLYLRFAQSSFEQVKSFLAKNLSKFNLSSQVSSAINSLIGIYNAMGSDFSMWNFTQVLLSNREFSDSYPVIRMMGAIYEEGKFTEILSPFAQIFNMAKVASVRDENQQEIAASTTKDTVEKDLQKIIKAYKGESLKGDTYDDLGELMIKKKKETKQEKLISLIRYCLSEFSSELQNSAAASGNKRLYNLFTQEALADPTYLTPLIGKPKNLDNIARDVRLLTKDIEKKISRSTIFDLCDAIRTRALYFSDVITEEQMNDHFIDKIRDIQGIMGHTDTPSEKRVNVNPQSILNNSYIMYVSFTIFTLLSLAK